MPARKPSSLHTAARTKATIAAREQAEAALTASGDVFAALPNALDGHAVAQVIWRYLAQHYAAAEAQVVTTWDRDLLIDYCLLTEQTVELDKLRAALLRKKEVNLDLVMKLDARLDRKRSLLHTFRQSLYLTPRARAGARPESKAAEEQPDDLERLLDDIDV